MAEYGQHSRHFKCRSLPFYEKKSKVYRFDKDHNLSDLALSGSAQLCCSNINTRQASMSLLPLLFCNKTFYTSFNSLALDTKRWTHQNVPLSSSPVQTTRPHTCASSSPVSPPSPSSSGSPSGAWRRRPRLFAGGTLHTTDAGLHSHAAGCGRAHCRAGRAHAGVRGGVGDQDARRFAQSVLVDAG